MRDAKHVIVALVSVLLLPLTSCSDDDAAYPGTPTGVTARPAVSGMNVYWKAAANAEYYCIRYSTNGNPDTALLESNSVTNTNYSITGLSNRVKYYVWVTASNENGCSPLGSCASVIPGIAYFEDFESGAAGWANSGTCNEWELGTPAYKDNYELTNCVSGTKCWGTDLDGTYENNVNCDLYSPVIDLSGISAPIRICWWQAWHSGSQLYDKIRVYYRINEGSWILIWYPLDGNFHGWSFLASSSISGASGKNIQLRFHLESDDVFPYMGMCIDDVEISFDGLYD